jgi:hypothetical protein
MICWCWLDASIHNALAVCRGRRFLGSVGDAAADPGMWGAVTLLGLALGYVRVVREDIDHEIRGTTSASKESWLTSMYQAETLFGGSLNGDDLATRRSEAMD